MSSLILGALILAGVFTVFFGVMKTWRLLVAFPKFLVSIPRRAVDAYVAWTIKRMLIREARARAEKAEAEAKNAEILDFFDGEKRRRK